jgi:superoxide dismutase, Cu-Zn family
MHSGQRIYFGKSLLLTATALLGACSTTAKTPPAPFARAEMVSASGQPAGSAVITPSGGTLEMRVTVSNLAPGVHGMHLHMVGSCEGPAFTSAGAHLNPHSKMHGHKNPQGQHLGDLPNITAAPDGRGDITFSLNAPASELEQYLLDGDGTAIVVHADPDDYRTDPTGNSGGRIACGILKRA